MPALKKIRVTLFLIPALALAFIAGHMAASAQTNPDSLAEIDRFVQEKIKAEHIPGVAVVITQGNEIIYSKGFGVASLRNPSPVTPHTVFDLASCSKSFTALAVMLLKEDGLIDLDRPVRDYLPAFQVADPEAAEKITVRQLLNHTSGLPGAFSEPSAFYSGPQAMERLVTTMPKVRLDRESGSSFEYSDLNYCLLGALIEKVSRVSFEEYVEQRIFLPLGMKYTTLYPDEASSLERADGHQLMFGRVVTRNILVYRSAAPAGWVMSCAEDMGRWLLLYLNEGRSGNRQVVSAEAIREMLTPGVFFTLDREAVGYGMGWFTGTINGLHAVWHGGDTPNFTAMMIMIPDQKLGIATLVNSQNSAAAHEIAPSIASLLLEKEFKLPAAPWWASWQMLDEMAIAAAVLALVLILALIIYVSWLWRQLRHYRHTIISAQSISRPRLTAKQIVLTMTPLIVLGTAVFVISIVAQTLVSYDPYQTLILFRMLSPPGVWLAGMIILAVIGLWMISLTGLILLKISSSPPTSRQRGAINENHS